MSSSSSSLDREAKCTSALPPPFLMVAPKGASRRAPPEALDVHLLVLRMLEVSHAQRHEAATKLQREWRQSLQRRAARDERLRNERVARARQSNKRYLAGLEHAGMEAVLKPPPVPMGWPPGVGPDLASPTSVVVDWEQWPPIAPPPPPLPAYGNGPSKAIEKPATETPQRKKPPPGRPPWAQHVVSEPATRQSSRRMPWAPGAALPAPGLSPGPQAIHMAALSPPAAVARAASQRTAPHTVQVEAPPLQAVPLPLAQRSKRSPGEQLLAACRGARRGGSKMLANLGAVQHRPWWRRSTSTPTATARWEKDAARWEHDTSRHGDAALAT